MEKGKELLFGLDRQRYTTLMAKNLPVLRAGLGVSQSDLAGIIGVTRQTLSAAESGARELSWGNFISLLYVFSQNEQTVPLLRALGIYTPELMSAFRVANLNDLNRQENMQKNKSKAGEMG